MVYIWLVYIDYCCGYLVRIHRVLWIDMSKLTPPNKKDKFRYGHNIDARPVGILLFIGLLILMYVGLK